MQRRSEYESGMTSGFIQVYHTRSWIWIISSLFLLLRVNTKVQDKLDLPNRTKKQVYNLPIIFHHYLGI